MHGGLEGGRRTVRGAEFQDGADSIYSVPRLAVLSSLSPGSVASFPGASVFRK